MKNLNYFSLPQKFKNSAFLKEKKISETKIKTFFLVKDSLVFYKGTIFITEKLFKEIPIKKKIIFLGENKKVFYYCATISASMHKKNVFFKNTERIEIRNSIKFLNSFFSSLVTYAFTMQNWYNNNKYCTKCGFKTVVLDKSKMLICTNKRCNNKIFPRINPTVIMSVLYKNRILLARNKNWPNSLYSCLAGFCENNESAEEAVKRETYEETNLKVFNIRYQYSQAWPFSNNLMLGFTAMSKSKTIKINEEEIEDARWFSKKELSLLVKKKEIKLPSKYAIARYLIDKWQLRS